MGCRLFPPRVRPTFALPWALLVARPRVRSQRHARDWHDGMAIRKQLLGMSDRIVVLHEGVVAGEIGKDEFSQDRVLELASGM